MILSENRLPLFGIMRESKTAPGGDDTGAAYRCEAPITS